MLNSSIRVTPSGNVDLSTYSLQSDDYFYVVVGREKKELLLSDSNSHLKSDFEERLKKCQAAVEWGEDPDRFGVRCLDHHADLLNWRKDARDFVNHYFGCIVVQSIHGSLPLSLDFLQKGFGNTSVFISRNSVTTKIVGHKESAEKVHDSIRTNIFGRDETVDGVNDQTSQLREVIQMKIQDAFIFVYCGIFDELQSQFSNICIEVYLQNAEIVLTGCQDDFEDIKECRIVIDEQIASITTFDKLPVTSGRAVLLKTNRVKAYVLSCQRDSKIRAYWEITESCFLILYVTNEEEKEKCLALIEEVVVEEQVTYPESFSVSDICQACQSHETNENMNVDFEIDPVTRLIKVTATKEDMKNIMNDLQHRINAESVFCVMDLYSPWAFELVMENFGDDIKEVVSNSPCSVWKKVSFYAFYIKGPANSLDSVRDEIGNVFSKIVHKDVIFESSCSSSEINDIIEKANRQTPLTVRRSQQHQLPRVSRTILVHAGNITDLDVDVIVVSSNIRMQMVYGLAKHILQKGGYSIQKECDRHVQEYGDMEEGSVYFSTPGNLNCLAVAHIVSAKYHWGENITSEENRLGQAVTRCLQQIENQNFRSVAFPALFTKMFRYDPEVAVHIIVDAVNNHLKTKVDSKIETIAFCDMDQNNVNLFLDKVKATPWKCGVVLDHSILSRYSPNYSVYLPDSGFRSVSVITESSLLPQTLGSLKIKVYVGDVTEIQVDVILNVTNQNLDMNLGPISKSVMENSNSDFILQMASKKKELKSKGFAITDEGHVGMKCKSVLHVDVNSILKAKMIRKALEKADQCYSNISIPVLIAGDSEKISSEFLSTLFKELERFGRRITNLKEIHLLSPTVENLQTVHGALRKQFIENGHIWVPTYNPIPRYNFILHGTSSDSINDGIEFLRKSLC